MRDALRNEPDQRHAHAPHVFDDVGIKMPHAARIGLLDVRRKNREMGFALGFPEILEPEVQLVIAHCARVISDGVHHQHHWIRLRRLILCEIISKWGALNRIAGVQQQ